MFLIIKFTLCAYEESYLWACLQTKPILKR